MNRQLFAEFLAGGDTLRVYEAGRLIFASDKDRLLPLLEYLAEFGPHHRPVTIFDRIMGNAAALLAVKAHGHEVYSPLGSQIAIKTLERYGIIYHLNEIVPHIQRPDGKDICPMEKLSIGKGPEEFFAAISARVNSRNRES